MKSHRVTVAALSAMAIVGLQVAGSGPLYGSQEAGAPDSGYALEGGTAGTALRSLTVEGEDRIQFEFERPTLRIDFEASRVAGLELGSALSVLNRSQPDLVPALLTSSTGSPSPYLGRPWLSNFATGSLARFQPDLEDVDRWTLSVADSRGETVATFQGKGNPPDEINWDGRTQSGGSAIPGLTYSYVLEAFDKAGNKRNFVGSGFQVPAYRVGPPESAMLVMSASSLTRGDAGGWASAMGGGATATPAMLLEAADWFNQGPSNSGPVRITVMARSYDQASSLANRVADWMRAETAGDPAAIQVATDVRPDAPAEATIRLARGLTSASKDSPTRATREGSSTSKK